MGAIAAIIRDGSGIFVAASCSFIQYAYKASAMEALAMKLSLSLVCSLGFSQIIAEFDSSEVIHACTSSTRWNEGAPIFADCMDLIASIGNVQFCHCLRKANSVAHEIGRHSFENNLSCIWVHVNII